MAAVAFAVVSAALFGAMSVFVRNALRLLPDGEAGAFVTSSTALVVCGTVALGGAQWHGDPLPFLAAGVLAPGASQILYILAIRDAGPSRTSVLVGVAPLISVGIALVALDEPLRAPLAAGAVLIVVGGLALATERVRPAAFRSTGMVFALASTFFFAGRDNVVRWSLGDTHVAPQLAASVSLVAGALTVASYLLVTRGRRAGSDIVRALPVFAPAGAVFGVSYALLFEAFSRGRVTVVSPLVATESLFGVVASWLVIRRHELVGRHLLAGALLIVAGGALIGVYR
jgi:drug/metabolite transporter (DMT)-like permease